MKCIYRTLHLWASIYEHRTSALPLRTNPSCEKLREQVAVGWAAGIIPIPNQYLARTTLRLKMMPFYLLKYTRPDLKSLSKTCLLSLTPWASRNLVK
mmetsp:Transcript_39820/g.98622  ORF Transcript_39820/g.98622 Transcript_39820/m.98622 type:complete len:97 (-) Transcript_39820:57-347(-)